jgi:hypothetical protein
MSIKEIYATNILIKQLDIDDEVMKIVETYLISQNLEFKANLENDLIEYRDGRENIIFDALNLNRCPEIKIIIDQIKQSFVELAYSNLMNCDESNREKMIFNAEIESCKINLMTTGSRLGIHTHYGDDAYAVFYFSDVEPKYGGELLIYDPRWSRNYTFGGSKIVRITPKRKQLVIAPSFLWHEVSQYNGKEDRLTLVVNGTVINEYDKIRVRRTEYV